MVHLYNDCKFEFFNCMLFANIKYVTKAINVIVFGLNRFFLNTFSRVKFQTLLQQNLFFPNNF